MSTIYYSIAKTDHGSQYIKQDTPFRMVFNGISFVYLIITGLAILIQAKIPVRITFIREPRNKDVFKGDRIKLKCESEGRAVNVSWHYRNHDTIPPITNSSNSTSIVTWNEDNKTISVITINVGDRKIGIFYIYCKARNEVNEIGYAYEPFEFVPDSNIPKISVTVPQTQTVMEETRRHNLRCEVSSNVKIDKLYITWLFGKQMIAEKLVTKADKGKHDYLLQCLTGNDLGNYTCVANTTMYGKVWQHSGVMLLTGKFPENSGMKNLPLLNLYCIIFLLIIWKTM